MTTTDIDTRRTLGRIAGVIATASVLTTTGCLRGGQTQSGAGYATPATDTSQTAAANRRIRAGASLDSLARLRAPGSVNYRIGPEDLLEVEVFGVETFSGSYRVDQTGAIALPLVDPVAVSGLTAREVEDAVEARLAETYVRDPHVTVRIGEMQSHGVSVVGAVNQPGVYQIPGPSSLLEVLARAQGLSEDAGNTVYVVRADASIPDSAPASFTSDEDSITASSAEVASGPGTAAWAGGSEQVVEVDLGTLLESGSAEHNVVVQPGDIVQVRTAGLVYVVGQVNRPGGFVVPPGKPMTVLQALAMAEGLGSMAAADRGVIVREHEDGTRQEFPVDLDKVLEGSEAPPSLMARDVLFVPRNDTKSFALGVVDAMVRMVTFRGLVY